MIVPVVAANEMSAGAGGEDVSTEFCLERAIRGRCGAGYESTGSDLASDGQEDQLMAGSRDSGHNGRQMQRLRERYDALTPSKLRHPREEPSNRKLRKRLPIRVCIHQGFSP